MATLTPARDDRGNPGGNTVIGPAGVDGTAAVDGPLTGDPGFDTGCDPTDEMVADIFARDCSSRRTLEDVAGKWGILALLALAEGDLRFNALRRRVQGVSEKMLSQTLQTLERDGMLRREVMTQIPPRVEYSLTSLGAEVAGRLRGLADLLEASVAQVDEARAAYDTRRVTA